MNRYLQYNKDTFFQVSIQYVPKNFNIFLNPIVLTDYVPILYLCPCDEKNLIDLLCILDPCMYLHCKIIQLFLPVFYLCPCEEMVWFAGVPLGRQGPTQDKRRPGKGLGGPHRWHTNCQLNENYFICFYFMSISCIYGIQTVSGVEYILFVSFQYVCKVE